MTEQFKFVQKRYNYYRCETTTNVNQKIYINIQSNSLYSYFSFENINNIKFKYTNIMLKLTYSLIFFLSFSWLQIISTIIFVVKFILIGSIIVIWLSFSLFSFFYLSLLFHVLGQIRFIGFSHIRSYDSILDGCL